MKTNLSNLPKLSDHGIKLNGPMTALQMIGYWTALQQWHVLFELKLKEKLEDAQRKEFGVGDWPYEYGRNKATQQLINEILNNPKESK
jgi:hypothetical protein